MSKVIFSTAYLPPLAYMAIMANYTEVIIEQHENFQKQTYRNRCVIYGANGPLNLVIPIATRREKINKVMASHEEDWMTIHWKSIATVYRSSPYFEFYEDDLAPLFSKQQDKLFDFNHLLLLKLIELLELDVKISFSSDYIHNFDGLDLRNSFRPQERATSGIVKQLKYIQVFSDKMRFEPNLFILDLLFNEGPNAGGILQEMGQSHELL